MTVGWQPLRILFTSLLSYNNSKGRRVDACRVDVVVDKSLRRGQMAAVFYVTFDERKLLLLRVAWGTDVCKIFLLGGFQNIYCSKSFSILAISVLKL